MEFVRACASGDLHLIKGHFERGGDINLKASREASNALHFAVTHGQYEVVELLLDKGVDVGSPNPHGSTPLHMAAFNGDHKMCWLLLSYRADAYKVDKKGRTPADYTMVTEVRDLLLDRAPDSEVKPYRVPPIWPFRRKQKPTDMRSSWERERSQREKDAREAGLRMLSELVPKAEQPTCTSSMFLLASACDQVRLDDPEDVSFRPMSKGGAGSRGIPPLTQFAVPSRMTSESLADCQRACHHDLQHMRELCERSKIPIYDGFYLHPRFGRQETVDAIRMFFAAVLVDVHYLYYTGAVQRRTGDWLCRDGFITFADVINMWNECGTGRLVIILDSNFSGIWNLGLSQLAIPPRLPVAIQCSCGPTEFSFATIGRGGFFTTYFTKSQLHGLNYYHPQLPACFTASLPSFFVRRHVGHVMNSRCCVQSSVHLVHHDDHPGECCSHIGPQHPVFIWRMPAPPPLPDLSVEELPTVEWTYNEGDTLVPSPALLPSLSRSSFTGNLTRRKSTNSNSPLSPNPPVSPRSPGLTLSTLASRRRFDVSVSLSTSPLPSKRKMMDFGGIPASPIASSSPRPQTVSSPIPVLNNRYSGAVSPFSSSSSPLATTSSPVNFPLLRKNPAISSASLLLTPTSSPSPRPPTSPRVGAGVAFGRASTSSAPRTPRTPRPLLTTIPTPRFTPRTSLPIANFGSSSSTSSSFGFTSSHQPQQNLTSSSQAQSALESWQEGLSTTLPEGMDVREHLATLQRRSQVPVSDLWDTERTPGYLLTGCRLALVSARLFLIEVEDDVVRDQASIL